MDVTEYSFIDRGWGERLIAYLIFEEAELKSKRESSRQRSSVDETVRVSGDTYLEAPSLERAPLADHYLSPPP